MTTARHVVAAVCLAAGLAALLRLPNLDRRPMHGDEAVHAVKFNELWTTGRYVYDCHDYHGPVLYYFTWPIAWLTGAADYRDLTESTFRIVPALFGVALILLILLVSDALGPKATIAAAVLTALSPAMVYYSRYYIQEMLLAFLAFAMIASGWRYACSGRFGWALAAGASAGLMHATKETCVIAWGAMMAALVGTRLLGQSSPSPASAGPAVSDPCTSAPGARWSGRAVPAVAGAVAAAGVVSLLCFSCFLTNPAGSLDSLLAVNTYLGRAAGVAAHHHPWYYYLKLLAWTHYPPAPVWSEAPILVLAVIGSVVALRPAGRRPAFLRFLALYAFLMAVVYSAIPYKTPWCAVQFLQPLILLAGVGAAELAGAVIHTWGRAALVALLLVGAAHLGNQAYLASFRYSADGRNPYVYAHPLNDVRRLGERVERLAAAHPERRRMLVKVIAPDSWPLPWYLRRLERVGYWETVPADPDAPVVITTAELQPQVGRHLKDTYQISHFGVRPGLVMVVCTEQRLWDAFVENNRPGQRSAGETRGP